MQTLKSFFHAFIVPLLLGLVAMLLAGAAMFSLMGCSADEAYIKADHATYSALVPDLDAGDGRTIEGMKSAIRNNPRLTDQERQDRLDLIDAWALRLKAHGHPVPTGP